MKKQQQTIKTEFEDTASSLGGNAKVNVEVMYPGFSFDSEDLVVQNAKKAAKSLDLPSELLNSGGGSDANIFNGYGIPTANLSVGYEHIHTTNERIHTSDLKKLTEFVIEIITQAIHN